MTLQGTDGDFLRCGSCHTRWPTWDTFAVDRGVRLLGFQGYVRAPHTNLLVFEHRCGSTVSILTSRLHHLLPPIEVEGLPSLRGTPECPRHCLSLEDVRACDRPCSNARERELIRIVLELRGEAGDGAPGRAGG